MIPGSTDHGVPRGDGPDRVRGAQALARLRAELQEIQLLLDGLRARITEVDPTGSADEHRDRRGREDGRDLGGSGRRG